MAIYFQLNRKSDGSLVTPAQADDEIREAMGAEPDPKNWYEYWYSRVGLQLAGNIGFAEIRGDWPELSEVINFIEDNYKVTNGWCR